MEAHASAPSGQRHGLGYPGSTVAAAVVATIFFPIISLIVALVLVGNQRDPAKRRALRTWAWGSVGWAVCQALVGIVLFAAGSGGTGIGPTYGGKVDRTGPCVGGPEIGASGTDISGNGTKFVMPCAISGTTTVNWPPPTH
jgi:hypothetical protein